MFADDMVILSETAEGLQNALNKLTDYCERWFLTINAEKTKVVIFNKNGKQLKGNFFVSNENIELTNKYTYLGVTLSNNGCFNNAIQDLCKKASKAMFKLKHTIYHLNLAPKLSLHLYNTLVRPICTFSSEIWGAFDKSQDKMFNILSDSYDSFDQACYEKLDLKFSKSILGVNKKSSNVAVRGELGRFPTIIFILKMVIKNWIRIVNYDNNSLLFDTYLCNLQLLYDKKKCWLSHIYHLINDKLGMQQMWVNQGHNKNMLNKCIKNMETIFEFQWKNELNRKCGKNRTGGNKLRTYNLFKTDFAYEKYLDMQPNFHMRQKITKFRISSHKLEIEVGRYSGRGKKIPEHERLCKHCDLHVIENEEHVLMYCPKYEFARKIMFLNLESIFPSFQQANNKIRFKFLMTCSDWEVTQYLSKMLATVSEIRGVL